AAAGHCSSSRFSGLNAQCHANAGADITICLGQSVTLGGNATVVMPLEDCPMTETMARLMCPILWSLHLPRAPAQSP
ncbi:MAG: hypothetical protein ACK54P_15195, partial [Bacteroidota bacterium]